MKLWKLLLAFLTLGAAEGEGAAPATPDPSTDAGTGDDDLFGETGDDLIDAAEAGGGAPKVEEEETPALKEARRRAQDAEERAERAERAARERPAPTAPTPTRDPDYEREEQEMAQARAAGSTPEQIAWLQWKIDSNRKMRASERTSQSALQESREIADRTAFEKLELTKPQVYKRYAERVEAAVNDMRAKGQAPAPRLAILRLLIGDDIMNGKVKPKAKAAPVERGRSPVIRSDTRGGKGTMTEHEKRKQRLANIRI